MIDENEDCPYCDYEDCDCEERRKVDEQLRIQKYQKPKTEGYGFKRLIVFLFLFIGTLGAITAVDKAFFPTFQTIQNPGFEQDTQYWTASGGTFITSTGNPLFGNAYGTWDASASSQTLCSNAVSVPIGLGNTNGEAYIYSNGTSAYTHTLEVRDGSGNVLGSTTLVNSPTLDGFSAAKTSLNFVFPTSASSVRLCVVAQANEPGIKLDGAYLGAATNIGTVAQAKYFGGLTYPGTTNCQWSQSGNATFTTYGADADCTTPSGSNLRGNASAPSTKIPGITFSSLPAGTYKLTANALFENDSNGCSYRFFDGTNGSPQTSPTFNGAGGTGGPWQVIGTFTYTTAQSNITFVLQTTGVTASATCDIFASDARRNFTIDVEYYPDSNQSAYTTDQSDYGPTPYGTTSDFTGFGTVSGINMYHWRVGSILHIMGTFTSGTTTGTEARIALPSGLTTVSTLPTLSVAGTFNYSNNSATTGYMLAEASKTYLTIGYQGGSSFSLAKKNGNDFLSSTVHSFRASVPISGWQTTNRAPQLVNSVLNTSSGQTRIEGALINCDGSSTATSQHGSWISSVGNISAGACVITITTGTFSSTPYCWTTSSSMGETNPSANISVTSTSATSQTIDCDNSSAGGDCTSYDVNFFCMGAK